MPSAEITFYKPTSHSQSDLTIDGLRKTFAALVLLGSADCEVEPIQVLATNP
jgi:hypothetical protein